MLASTEPSSRRPRWSDNPIVKLAVLGFLLLVLLIPIASITSLVRERQARAAEARAAVVATWGSAQTLAGPLLSILPDEESFGQRPGLHAGTFLPPDGVLHLAPRVLRWSGTLHPEVRRRGMFDAVVYTARLKGEAEFVLPPAAFTGARSSAERRRGVVWLSLDELGGLEAAPRLRWNGAEVKLRPGSVDTLLVAGAVHGFLPALPPVGVPVRATFELELRGSELLRLAALGEDVKIELAGDWHSPSFEGTRLPAQRSVGPERFRARWALPPFGRSVPPSWTAGEIDPRTFVADAVGVRLDLPADAYQRTERAAKYALLLVLLVFSTVFLLEVVRGARVHPIQYLLIGFALSLFYLLLLALAEHTGFDAAYAVAAVATTLLVGLYGVATLPTRAAAAAVASTLGGLYAYFYLLLRLPDGSLVVGAVGLFVLLATAMYLTRRVDWYAPRAAATDAAGGAVYELTADP